ncbi:MAG: prepilin peptidase [Verrucomicrobia bacterium]|nr:prepilin peptidase [Verrucomicrobiota bacterium]
MQVSDYKRLSCRIPEAPLKGIDEVVNRWIGACRRRAEILQQLERDAETVCGLQKELGNLDDHHLQQKLFHHREQARRNGHLKEDLIPSLAAVREAARRQLGLHAFPVQIMGALALHRGMLAEMATGEGKTLTAALAAVLCGWTQHPCHVVTVNDYLVTRDAMWVHPLFRFCGVRVGAVTASMDSAQRRKGYEADVTYTTSKELLADFLRDQIRVQPIAHPTRRLIRRMLSPQAFSKEMLVQRGLHTAIVDEADSILIDEAVTPLIISSSRPNPSLTEAASLASELASELDPEVDYTKNLRYREVEFTESGLAKLAERCGRLPGLWRGPERRSEIIRQALVAREFFIRGKQYIVESEKIIIVDEFTGRPMPQRTWREGLHQAIEAKEGLKFSDPSETIARMSFQRFFRCFRRLSGMTGTAAEAANELWQIYALPVIRIPTHRPCIRVQQPDLWFPSRESKTEALIRDIEQLHKQGRPVLVGTRSVAYSEELTTLLTGKRIPCQVLNAQRQQAEAEIVALAGEPGKITIATNMAGRGTDIRLGEGVAGLGGLHVIATERHESGRVDRQLFGRSGRQGDAGSAQVYLSAEDDLFTRHLPVSVQKLLPRPSSGSGMPGGIMARGLVKAAQAKAQRMAWKQRLAVLRADEWLKDSLSFTGNNG